MNVSLLVTMHSVLILEVTYPFRQEMSHLFNVCMHVCDSESRQYFLLSFPGGSSVCVLECVPMLLGMPHCSMSFQVAYKKSSHAEQHNMYTAPSYIADVGYV